MKVTLISLFLMAFILPLSKTYAQVQCQPSQDALTCYNLALQELQAAQASFAEQKAALEERLLALESQVATLTEQLGETDAGVITLANEVSGLIKTGDLVEFIHPDSDAAEQGTVRLACYWKEDNPNECHLYTEGQYNSAPDRAKFQIVR